MPELALKRGQRILDVGSGWGGFAAWAAEKYGVSVVGITVSNEQAQYMREKYAHLPIEVRVCDWRDLNGEKFDHIVSIGMFEHVGTKNYRNFFKKMSSLLDDEGLFLLHTIGHSRTTPSLEPWFNKYIFPNGHLPSMKEITTAIDRIWMGEPEFIVEDWHNFGADYFLTISRWVENFKDGWPTLKEKYDERLYRMWIYYLSMSAGGFRARHFELWQIVLSKKGVLGGYQSIR